MEKIILNSKSDKKSIFGIICAVGVLFATVIIVLFYNGYDYEQRANYAWDAAQYTEVLYGRQSDKYKDDMESYHEKCDISETMYNIMYVFIGLAVITIVIIIVAYNAVELTITNKRIYGKTSFMKYVDIPLDSISSIQKGFPKSVVLRCMSGESAFPFIVDREIIYTELQKLLMNKSEKTENQSSLSTNLEDLKKLKELLDDGIISQEEFDVKKKQLLGM